MFNSTRRGIRTTTSTGSAAQPGRAKAGPSTGHARGRRGHRQRRELTGSIFPSSRSGEARQTSQQVRNQDARRASTGPPAKSASRVANGRTPGARAAWRTTGAPEQRAEAPASEVGPRPRARKQANAAQRAKRGFTRSGWTTANGRPRAGFLSGSALRHRPTLTPVCHRAPNEVRGNLAAHPAMSCCMLGARVAVRDRRAG